MARPAGCGGLPPGVPSKAVPAPAAEVMPPRPVELMLTTSCEPSNAKLFGAVIAEPLVVHVEMSSSATNASSYICPT